MASIKRLAGRIAALSTAPLTPEMLVPELLVALQQALGTNGVLPAVLVHDTAMGALHEFTVWRGSEFVDAAREMLRLGIWPAPSSIPSVQTLMTTRLARSVFAAPLWGEGCTEDGPWVPLWRERNVRHGYYLAAFAPSGRVCVALMSRGANLPSFTNADLALGEAVAHLVARAVDIRPPALLPCDTVVAEVPLAFGTDGSLSAMGVGAPEQLRDLGGGGSSAMATARELVERAAAQFRDAILQDGAASAAALPLASQWLGGSEEDAAFRRGNFALMQNNRTRMPHTLALLQNPHGAFELQVAASNAIDSGGLQVLGTLRRRVPRLLTVLRGLIEVAAPGREIELAIHLCAGTSVPDAALALGMSTTTARTLVDRLAMRVSTSGQERVLEALAQVGRAVLR